MSKLLLLVVSISIAAWGQRADAPLSASVKGLYGMGKGYITRAAEKMSEQDYSFKPTPEVRSFGQLVGHVSDANYTFCSAVLGEKPPVRGIEKSKTSKAELVEALKASFTYCDRAYDGMTDAAASETITFFGQERPKLAVLVFNNMHDYEHYGNMVTYMRMKGVVPPSSESRR